MVYKKRIHLLIQWEYKKGKSISKEDQIKRGIPPHWIFYTDIWMIRWWYVTKLNRNYQMYQIALWENASLITVCISLPLHIFPCVKIKGYSHWYLSHYIHFEEASIKSYSRYLNILILNKPVYRNWIIIRYTKNHTMVICCKTHLILHHAFMTGCTHEYEEQLFVTTRQNDVGVRLNLFCKQNPDVIYR